MSKKQQILQHLEQDYIQDYRIVEIKYNRNIHSNKIEFVRIKIEYENLLTYSSTNYLRSLGYYFSYCEVVNNSIVGVFCRFD